MAEKENQTLAEVAFNNFSDLAQPGTGTLKVDGKVVATKDDGKDPADDLAMG